MRIIIRFSKTEELVPINNQSYVNYYIYKKCLGDNNVYHDAKSNYCISSIQGGKLTSDKKNLKFDNGGFIVVTSKDETFLNDLIGGVMNNPKLNWGMEYVNIEFVRENFTDGWNHFATLSPFIIKKNNGYKSYSFSTMNDVDFIQTIHNHLVKKINNRYPHIDTTELKVRVNSHPSHKIKLIRVKNVENETNQCHISLFCDKTLAEIIYNMGIGQSTGSGFGTIYKTENHKIYRN